MNTSKERFQGIEELVKEDDYELWWKRTRRKSYPKMQQEELRAVDPEQVRRLTADKLLKEYDEGETDEKGDFWDRCFWEE